MLVSWAVIVELVSKATIEFNGDLFFFFFIFFIFFICFVFSVFSVFSVFFVFFVFSVFFVYFFLKRRWPFASYIRGPLVCEKPQKRKKYSNVGHILTWDAVKTPFIGSWSGVLLHSILPPIPPKIIEIKFWILSGHFTFFYVRKNISKLFKRFICPKRISTESQNLKFHRQFSSKIVEIIIWIIQR